MDIERRSLETLTSQRRAVRGWPEAPAWASSISAHAAEGFADPLKPNPCQRGRRSAMLTRLSALVLPAIIMWGVILSVSLISAGPALANKIIANG